MALNCGIIGLPNVGKSTIFNALVGGKALVANFPFSTVEANVGVAVVPDERLTRLTQIFKSKKTTPTAIEFRDIAGLVQGSSVGEGLGNQFLSQVREADALEEQRVHEPELPSGAEIARGRAARLVRRRHPDHVAGDLHTGGKGRVGLRGEGGHDELHLGVLPVGGDGTLPQREARLEIPGREHGGCRPLGGVQCDHRTAGTGGFVRRGERGGGATHRYSGGGASPSRMGRRDAGPSEPLTTAPTR